MMMEKHKYDIALKVVAVAPALALAATAPAAGLQAHEGLSRAEARDGGVEVLCEDETRPGSYFQSRAAALETRPEEGREVLVASGHAFLREDGGLRECVVRTERSVRRVDAVRLPAEGDDWAVAQVDGRFREPVRRWRLPDDPERAVALVEEGGILTFYPGDPERRPCRALGDAQGVPGGEEAPPGSLLNDCPGRPGQSGSPVAAEIDGEARLVAVYVGRLDGRGEDLVDYGVARPVSGAFAEAARDAAGAQEP